MMTYLDRIGWVCLACLKRYYWPQEAIATDADPDMRRQCVECKC
jgi:hypothetical protein